MPFPWKQKQINKNIKMIQLGSLKSLKLDCISEQIMNSLNGNMTYSGVWGGRAGEKGVK